MSFFKKLLGKKKESKTIIDGVAIGIDLGTTFSCVGLCDQSGKVMIFQDKHNKTTQASHVYFNSDGTEVVGNLAKDYSVRDSSNVVYNSKRFIGKAYDDPALKIESKFSTFKTLKDTTNNQVLIQVPNRKNPLTPQEVSSKILILMKSIAEDNIKKKVKNVKITDAVITVPAYFNDGQRKATKEAGRIAGLNVLKILNEPTAAAIAFGLQCEENKSKYVLIYDLGGGTFDISLLFIKGSEYKVLAVNGDTHLGGEDFDNLLVTYVQNLYFQKYKYDIMKVQNQFKKLKKSCEDAKIKLSSELLTKIIIKPNDGDGKNQLSINITRENFEKICEPLFKKTLDLVASTLKDGSKKPSDIESVVLIGGSTKIPKISQMLEAYFNKKPISSLNPDEAVAMGASIVAASYMKETSQKIKEINLHDVIPLSIGIKGLSDKMHVVLKRNSSFPISASMDCCTYEDNQAFVNMPIFQGERPRAVDNFCIGDFIFENLPKGKARSVVINVNLEVDTDGILILKAKEEMTGKKINVKVTQNIQMSDADLKHYLDEVEKNKEADAKLRERYKIIDNLEEICDLISSILK